ncbi:hypothetical protein V1505DRAFT_358806 [Lipomyces doorenjongii]
MKESEGMRPGPVTLDHSPENSSLQSKWRMSQIKSSAKTGETVFVASDRNFLIVRRFNHLQARLLLQVQDEVRKFEAQLDAMDKGPLLACESLQFREMDEDLSGRRK